MRIDRFHPAAIAADRLDAAVVVDVLRATTTAVVLLARGARAVRVVATPDELAALPGPAGGYLVFSELDASRGFGLECVDNSPALADTRALAGRAPVLVTTNGTRAVAAAMEVAERVLVAGFVNLSATARHLVAAGRDVALLPAGDFAGRDTRTEDERCADALGELLAGRTPDLPALLADCRGDARVQRRIGRHPELVADVELALSVDRCPVVAGAARDAGGAIEIVRLD